MSPALDTYQGAKCLPPDRPRGLGFLLCCLELHLDWDFCGNLRLKVNWRPSFLVKLISFSCLTVLRASNSTSFSPLQSDLPSWCGETLAPTPEMLESLGEVLLAHSGEGARGFCRVCRNA